MGAPMTVILPREVARERKITRYTDGEPCIHGHYGSRWTTDNACYECKRVKVASRDSSKYAEQRKAYSQRDDVKERLAAWQREDRKKNPEKHAVWDKTKYEKIKDTPKERERQSKKQQAKYWSDPERFKQIARERHARPEIGERNRERSKKYKQNNPDKVRELNLKHNHKDRTARKQRLPKWVTSEELAYITEMYRMAKTLGMHVDHIIPLQGKNVSGLHVLANLQLLAPSENLAKKNKYEVTV